jgi:hypothetical protein
MDDGREQWIRGSIVSLCCIEWGYALSGGAA